MEKWSRSVAVVTGANSGNGFGILKKLANAGITVVGFDIVTKTIDEFKEKNPDLKVYSIVCDITNDDETSVAFDWVEDTLGGVDILVNNAGTLRSIGILEHEKPMSELAFNIDLNFTSVIRCSRLAFKSMEARKTYGYIINICSVYGHAIPFMPGVQTGVYAGTKWAITASTEVMRRELNEMKNIKVRVTTVSPGVVDTNIFRAAGASDEAHQGLMEKPHLNIDEIGDTIAYLLSLPYHLNVHDITIRATGADI
jgi:NADP+-dependent farnesol dehydrogenase